MTPAYLSIVQPRRPKAGAEGWREHPIPDGMPQFGYPVEVWAHDVTKLVVMSGVEVADEPGQPRLGPQYHLSVSRSGRRCSSDDALWALAQFDLSDAKEDNHVPSGRVRNFWRPVADHLSGYECQCVDDEPAMREDKGDFVWRGVTT